MKKIVLFVLLLLAAAPALAWAEMFSLPDDISITIPENWARKPEVENDRLLFSAFKESKGGVTACVMVSRIQGEMPFTYVDLAKLKGEEKKTFLKAFASKYPEYVDTLKYIELRQIVTLGLSSQHGITLVEMGFAGEMANIPIGIFTRIAFFKDRLVRVFLWFTLTSLNENEDKYIEIMDSFNPGKLLVAGGVGT